MDQLNAYVFGGGVGFLVGFCLMFLLLQAVVRRQLQRKSDTVLQERKDQFIALTSHYLLNPITIIQTAITTLQEKQMTATLEERQHLYEAIERGQQRLWIMAEQLVLVGQIDQGDLKLSLTVSNLPETIAAAIASVDTFAREKKVTINFKYNNTEFMQDQARFDARRMKQVFIAVLDNAIKFSLESGVVEVRLSLESNIFSILVEDHGIGMPEETLSHISEKFYRGTALYNFDYQGFGLGLHIAQAIVRLHQGNIVFTSKPQRGTVTAIQFPNL